MKRRELVAAALALAVDPARALGAATGGGVVALATADLESHVVALELSTGRVLKRIRTTSGPRSVEASPYGRVVVAHLPAGIVTILDTATLSVRSVLRGFGEPRYAAMHPGEPDERMNGIALNRAWGPKRTWAYTLYNGGASHAFVHALNTRTRTARCIGLPWEGEEQTVLEEAQMAVRGGFLTLREPGGDLLARIDTRTFAVET